MNMSDYFISRNREFIISLVTEMYTDSDEKLKEAEIISVHDRPPNTEDNFVEFKDFMIWYDKKENTIYI